MSSLRRISAASAATFLAGLLAGPLYGAPVGSLVEPKAKAAETPPPANSSPMAELKKSNAQLDKVMQKNKPNWSPEAELERSEVKKLVGSFLDYGELARRSLNKNWDKITPKQREEFVETLRQLVERSYLWAEKPGGDILCEVVVYPGPTRYDDGARASRIIAHARTS